MSTIIFEEILLRLKSALGVKEDQQVAELLGFTKEAFSARKQRNSIPTATIKAYCHEHGIDAEWVLKGTGKISGTAPQTIAEQVGEGYSPEVKLMADYLEVKVAGKSREERLAIVEELMADIRARYK